MKYMEISLDILGKIKRPLKFDIYVKRTEKSFTKIFKKLDNLDWDRVATYKKKGIEFFYVTEEDYVVYTLFIEKLGEALVNTVGKFTPGESAAVIKELVNYTIDEMANNFNMEKRLFENAGNVVKGCIKTLEREPKTLLQIISLMSNRPYIIKHSVTVSMFAIIIAQHVGFESETSLNHIGLGAFLHDIGVGQLTFDPEDMKFLTPEQRKEMWRHPELGKNLLDSLQTIRSEVSMMVMQHHEQPNGHGYPNGLRDVEIYPPSKVVAIADCFAALITNRSYRDAFSVEKAITLMEEDVGKFDKKMFAIFKELFLPCP